MTQGFNAERTRLIGIALRSEDGFLPRSLARTPEVKDAQITALELKQALKMAEERPFLARKLYPQFF